MSKKNELEKLIRNKIRVLEEELEKGDANASLAKLRRGIGHIPGEIPEILGFILEGMPEDFLSNTGVPTKEEWTVYTTLTLYALHQQGWSTSRNMEEKASMGKSLSVLVKLENELPQHMSAVPYPLPLSC